MISVFEGDKLSVKSQDILFKWLVWQSIYSRIETWRSLLGICEKPAPLQPFGHPSDLSPFYLTTWRSTNSSTSDLPASFSSPILRCKPIKVWWGPNKMQGCTDGTLGTREQLGETQEQSASASPLGSLLASLLCPWNPQVCTFLILIFSHGIMAPCFQLRFGHINNPQLQLGFPAHVSKGRVRQVWLPHKRPPQRHGGWEGKIFPSIIHNTFCLMIFFLIAHIQNYTRKKRAYTKSCKQNQNKKNPVYMLCWKNVKTL